ncbi:MAG: helix-turn-helix domain-containing protein [Acidobacteriota bacterium]|nr:helix-turn-helix domain-containing protein [Acidobacteriota bacterium]
METTAAYSTAEALDMLCALSQESRLDIFRLLVQSGPDGLAAGAIARHCHLPAPTCSFHLKELKKGGLLRCCRHGRSQIYTVNLQGIRDLLDYLTEHCCTEDCEHEAPNGANGAEPETGD